MVKWNSAPSAPGPSAGQLSAVECGAVRTPRSRGSRPSAARCVRSASDRTGSARMAAGSSGSSSSTGLRQQPVVAGAERHRHRDRPLRRPQFLQLAGGEGRSGEHRGALDSEAGREVCAVGESRRVHARAIDGQPRLDIGQHPVDEADVVSGEGRIRGVAEWAILNVDLGAQGAVVPLGDPPAGVEHPVAQPGREDGDEAGRVGLFTPAGDPQELLAVSRAPWNMNTTGAPSSLGRVAGT